MKPTDVQPEDGRAQDQVILIDPAGYLCGHYTLQQALMLPEEFQQEGDIVKLAKRQTEARRLFLLRLSLDNPQLPPDRRKAVETAIEKLELKGITVDADDSSVLPDPVPHQMVRELQLSEPLPALTGDVAKEPKQAELQLPRIENPRYVTRSRSGMYLGSHTVAKAKALWPGSALQASVIVVAQNINAKQVSKILKDSTYGPNAYDSPQVATSASAARMNILKVDAASLPKLLREMKDTVVSVFDRDGAAVGSTRYDKLTGLYGNEWFFVSPGIAQVTRGAVSAAVLETTNGSAAVTMPFSVYDIGGRPVYQCGVKKEQAVRDYLVTNLPQASFESSPDSIRLKKSIDSLGFKSQREFAEMCAAVSNGKKVKHRWPNQERPSSNKTAEENKPVSFDGPEHVLYVSKGTLSCERRGHVVESATGSIVTLKGRLVNINVNYCNNCRRYFIGQREYEHYRDQYGPILGNFSFPASAQGGSGSGALSKESPLMMCGYNVREDGGLTSRERQLILANIIDRRILSKPRIIEYLQFFISWREGNPSMRNACDKWRKDLDFVRAYKMDTQRRFTIETVRRGR